MPEKLQVVRKTTVVVEAIQYPAKGSKVRLFLASCILKKSDHLRHDLDAVKRKAVGIVKEK